MDCKNIGKAIKIVRVMRGITQKELRELSHCGLVYISMIESGKSVPSLKILNNICESLNVSINFILSLSKIDGEKLIELLKKELN